MSMWWDADAQRYRTSLPYKIFYVWGWPAIRWTMFNFISSERAHVLAIHYGIPFVGKIDRVWTAVKIIAIVVYVIGLRLLAFAPGFSLAPSPRRATSDE